MLWLQQGVHIGFCIIMWKISDFEMYENRGFSQNNMEPTNYGGFNYGNSKVTKQKDTG